MTRKDLVLSEINVVMPWYALVAEIQPFYRKGERYDMTELNFATIITLLSVKVLILNEGLVVDASIIADSPSNKNQDRERDPEMRLTKKGYRCYFGMKKHFGFDADSASIQILINTKDNANHFT